MSCGTCPKCGLGAMSGPRFHRNACGVESLTYICRTCGYDEDRPTADHDKKAEVFEMARAAAGRTTGERR